LGVLFESNYSFWFYSRVLLTATADNDTFVCCCVGWQAVGTEGRHNR